MPASGNIAAEARAYPFGRHVLGGVQPARRHRAHLGIPIARSTGTRTPTASAPSFWERAWSPKRKAFTAAFGSDDLDASVLLLPEFGLIELDDPRFVSTVTAIERELLSHKHMMRYVADDDFGVPETRVPDLPLLADRCVVVVGPQAGSARSVRRRACATAITTA